MVSILRAAAAALSVLLAGCVTARDYTAPKQRITDGTAYSLINREVRIDVGAVGTELSDLGANMTVAAGFGRGGQVSTNLAHLSLGLANASVKYTALDRPWVGLSLEGSFLWTRPRSIWLLPDEVADPLAGIDLYIIPLKVTTSAPVTRWLSLHMGFGYTHAEIVGELSGDSGFFKGGIGARIVELQPAAHVYLNSRAALLLSANVPVFATAATQVESDVDIGEGIAAGVRSAQWVRISTQGATRGALGAEVRFGQRTHLQVFVARSILASANIGPEVLPSFNLYWRI